MAGKGDVEEGGQTFEGTRSTELIRKGLREGWEWGIFNSLDFDIATQIHTHKEGTMQQQYDCDGCVVSLGKGRRR